MGVLGGPRASLEVSLGTLGGAWGPRGTPWRVLGGSLGFLGLPRGPLGLPMGVPRGPHVET